MNKQTGIGLLELMLSLAIIAVLLVSMLRYFQVTRSAQQINTAVSMLQTTTTAADSWFWTFKTYQGTKNGDISIENLADMGLVPDNFKLATANPWGGSISVTPESATAVAIELTSISQADCINLQEIMSRKNLLGLCSPGADTFTLTYSSS